jgi:bud site selection protein 31
MPRVPLSPPEDYEKVRPFLEQMDAEMQRAVNAPVSSNYAENFWPVFQLHHQRSRHIYNLLQHGEIDRSLYDYLKENGFVDHSLVCHWRRQGYESLCCLRCIQPADTKHGNVCICRVPQKSITAEQMVQCDNCGCRGCSGY